MRSSSNRLWHTASPAPEASEGPPGISGAEPPHGFEGRPASNSVAFADDSSDDPRTQTDRAKADHFKGFTRCSHMPESESAEESKGELQRAMSWIDTGATAKDCASRMMKLWALEEPERTGMLADFVGSGRFEKTVQAVILLNCVIMFYSANDEMQNFDSPSEMTPHFDVAFQVFYTGELVLKMIVHRGFFFWNEDAGFNAFDFFLVVGGFVDLLGASSGGSGSVALRAVRVLKLGKALRVLKVIKGFKELRAIIVCIQGSFVNLLWSVFMLCIVFYVFSLIFVQQAAGKLQEIGDPTDERIAELVDSFDSVQTSMLTLTKAVFGGDPWVIYDLLSKCGWTSSLCYLTFVAFTQIALINIIMGIFVENAMQNLAPDKETLAQERQEEEEGYAKELKKLCIEVDDDQSGSLSKEQFARGLSRGRLPLLLQLLGLSRTQVQRLFELLADSDMEGEVDISSFVRGCMRLKGTATSFDLQMLTVDIQSFQSLFVKETRALHKRLDKVETGLGIQSPSKLLGPSSSQPQIANGAMSSAAPAAADEGAALF